ncbi:hypothetical protein QCA50_001947 [Cerrena zonata]|uniref:Uncharacterized protein n=1 Tax=Cerrena zonata TaxID=2478898 RepID=A0AAW0GUI7_9APHY
MDTDMNMDSDTTTNMEMPQVDMQPPAPAPQDMSSFPPLPQELPSNTPSSSGIPSGPLFQSTGIFTHATNSSYPGAPSSAIVPSQQGPVVAREIIVKVHIRRPERDSWAYLGRAVVSQEVVGKSNRIVVKSLTSHKILTVFAESTALQAEKRGNFVVVGCVEGTRVISWSLNALNNSETLRLLAIIELSCTTTKHFNTDPHVQNSTKRRIARLIRDDRKKRHKRRKDQDAMIAAFEKTGLGDGGANVQQAQTMQTS